MNNRLWVNKYRPGTLDGYVFVDKSQERQVEEWISKKTIPHLMFSGSPGTGKTTLAKIILNEIGVNRYDLKEVNASKDNSVEYIRDKIIGFISTMPQGDFKVVLLDEADYLSPNAQAVLRGALETYDDSARFILTCNYPHKIIPALHSRCQGFHIDAIDHTEFTARVAEILFAEEVEFDLDTLDEYVKATYPDLRKCINLVDQNSLGGVLTKSKSSGAGSDFKVEAIKLFKAGDIRNARRTLCSNILASDVDGLITWSYNNLGLFAKTEEGVDKAILIIRDAAANVPMIADPEINLSAMFIELANIEEEK